MKTLAAQEADEHLKNYLATVPRKGVDVILHAHGVSAEDTADLLREIADRIEDGIDSSILGGYNRGYWFDVKRKEV